MKDQNQSVDRRKFLSTLGLGAVAVTGAALSSGCSSSSNPLNSLGVNVSISDGNSEDLYPIYKDGEYQIKDFSHLLRDKNLGLSAKILDNHLGLYKNYVKKVNAAEVNMQKGIVDEPSLKNLAFSLNGMALHDIYFTNMNSENKKRSAALEKAIKESFGSFETYFKNLTDIAKQVEGWSITGVNLLNGKILNYGENNHSSNFPNYVMPILALDVYKHAYEMDFGDSADGKNKYIEVFERIIDWEVVSVRFDKLRLTFN